MICTMRLFNSDEHIAARRTASSSCNTTLESACWHGVEGASFVDSFGEAAVDIALRSEFIRLLNSGSPLALVPNEKCDHAMKCFTIDYLASNLD